MIHIMDIISTNVFFLNQLKTGYLNFINNKENQLIVIIKCYT